MKIAEGDIQYAEPHDLHLSNYPRPVLLLSFSVALPPILLRQQGEI